MYLCKSGLSTQVTCGKVEYVDTTVDYNDGFGRQKVAKIRNDDNVSDDYSSGGDSGSITFDPYNFLIYGIHSGGEDPTGGPNSFGLFTKVGDAMDHFSSSTNPFSIYISNEEHRVSY